MKKLRPNRLRLYHRLHLLVVKHDYLFGWYVLFVALSFFSCNPRDKFQAAIEKSMDFKESGDYIKALEYVNTGININSKKSFAFVLKGQIESLLERDTSAILSFNQAIYINPHNTSAYYHRALSYSLLDLDDSAISNFNKALQTKQDSGSVYFEHISNEHLDFEEQTDVPVYLIRYFRGVSFINLKKNEEAVTDFKYALYNGYNIPYSNYYLGVALARLGNKLEACKYLQFAKNGGNKEAEKLLLEYCTN